MMRNYSKTIGALAVASAVMAGHAGAEIEGEVSVGYHTDYIFRGVDLGQDLTDAAVEIGYDLGRVALSGGAWYGSVDEDPVFGLFSFDELQVFAEASTDLGAGFRGRVGWIHYDTDTLLGLLDREDHEIYFGVGYELPFYGIAADLTYFWDVDGDNEGYSELALGKNIAINECWSVDLGGNLGYFFEQDGFSHATLKAAVNYHLTENATLTGYVAHVWELDELEGSPRSFRGLVGLGEENKLFGGVGLAVSF